MNIVKVISLLITGAILGYSFSFIGKAHNDEQTLEDVVITSKITTSSPVTENESDPTNNKKNVTTDSQPIDTSRLSKERNTGDKELPQKHLDLIETYKTLKQEHQESLNKISSLKRQLGQLDESDVTDEEMEKLVPKPFKSFLSSFRGETRNDIFDFHNKEDDLDWGYDKRNNISDYIQTHFEGTNIEVVSIICKQPKCEILITEKQENAWDNIMNDMTQQSWWNFSSFTSSTRSNAENEMSIYMFLSQ